MARQLPGTPPGLVLEIGPRMEAKMKHNNREINFEKPENFREDGVEPGKTPLENEDSKAAMDLVRMISARGVVRVPSPAYDGISCPPYNAPFGPDLEDDFDTLLPMVIWYEKQSLSRIVQEALRHRSVHQIVSYYGKGVYLVDSDKYARHQRTEEPDHKYAPLPFVDRPHSSLQADAARDPPPQASPVSKRAKSAEPNEMTRKKCCGCGESKDEKDFSKTQWHRGGKAKCKGCVGTRANKGPAEEGMEIEEARKKRARESGADQDAASSEAGTRG